MTGCWSVANRTGLNHFLHLWHKASHVWFTLNSENIPRGDIELLVSRASQVKTYSHSTLMCILNCTATSSLTQTMPLLLVLQLIFCQEEAIIANKTTSLAQCLSCQRKFIELPVCSPYGYPESCTIARHKSRWKMWNRWRESEEWRYRQDQTRKNSCSLVWLICQRAASHFSLVIVQPHERHKTRTLGFGRPAGLLHSFIGSIS